MLAADILEILALHLADQRLERGNLLIGDRDRGERRRFALEQAPCLGQLERADVEPDHRRILGRIVDNEDASAVAGPDQPDHIERDHRLADRRAADLIFFGEVTFRRDALARRELTALNRAGNGRGHLLVQFARVRLQAGGRRWGDWSGQLFFRHKAFAA